MKRILLPALGSLALLATQLLAQNPTDPDSELASFKVAEGFHVNLFASEKDGVVKPIQIRFDVRGRLWVIGSTVYPQIEPGQTPRDKVLILEDTNGDGRSDHTTVFADSLMIPTGIELGDGGAYIGHGSELLFLKDLDGDGRADMRRVVLRGFGTGDNHQNINSFTWGPGGELWFSQGLHTHSSVETPWGIVRMNQAGIWRLRPRQLRLEPFYGFGHEPQNPWGFVFTDWGEPIVLAGNNSSPIYAVPGLVPNRRDEPPPLIWPTGQGRKVSGGDIVGNDHFPPEWQGLLVTGGYINNAVWAVKLADDGAGFRFQDAPPLIKSTDRAFRPVDAKFGPDGALYICDWYNPIIGHYQASFRHPDRDKTHGRIWRVTANGRPLTKPPPLASASVPQLLDFLKSPDRWTRHFAKRVLADQPRDEVRTALDQWIAQPGLSEHALKEALGVYQSHELVARDLVAKLARARDPGARAYSAGVIGLWTDRIPDALFLLRPLAADEHPRVRVQAVVASTYVRAPEAIEVALIAADHPTDRFLDYALRQAVFSLKPVWLTPFRTGKLTFENKASRIGWLVRADSTPDTLEALREMLRSQTISPSARETYWRLLAETGESTDFAAVLSLGDSDLQQRVLPAFVAAARARKMRPSGDVEALLRPLISLNSHAQADAIRLAGIWKIEPFRSGISAVALDSTAAVDLRRAAIESLGSFGDGPAMADLKKLARDDLAPIRTAAIVALCASDLKSGALAAVDALARSRHGAAEIFLAFLGRQGGAASLADTFASTPPSKDAAEIGLQLMNSSGKRHPELARLLAASAGLDDEKLKIDMTAIHDFISEVSASGDPVRGEAVYRKPELGCVACHSVKGQGGNLGPDLSALGSAQPVDFIVGAILDPQKEIKEGYTSVLITTRNGDEFQGYILRETPSEILLRDVVQNREVRIARGDIKERRSGGSVMPEGLVSTLTRAEFRDLVRYLSELGVTKKVERDGDDRGVPPRSGD